MEFISNETEPRRRTDLILFLGLFLLFRAALPNDALAVNLAPNPSFERADNPSFPNGWTNYPETGFYPYDRVQLDDTQAFHGKKSLRIHVVPLLQVEEPYRAPYVFCYGIRTVPGLVPAVPCEPESAPCTLSAYLKADTPGVSVRMGTTGAHENAERKVVLSTEWQRFSVPLRPCASPGDAPARPEIYFRAADDTRPYTFWVDAVQLEPGPEPTPFHTQPPDSGPDVDPASGTSQDSHTGRSLPGKTVPGVGLSVAPLQEAFLDRNYYTCEPYAVLTLSVRSGGPIPPGPMTARVALERPEERISQAIHPGENEIRLPLEGVPEGKGPVRVSLIDGKGVLLEETLLTLDRKPRSANEVKIDRKQMCLLVQGRPFLPYLFGIGSPSPWPEAVRESCRMGFNGVITPFQVFGKQQDLKTVRRELDRIHGLGMKALVWILPDHDDPACGSPPWDDPACLQAHALALERRIRIALPALRDHPAVLAWKFADEWWDREQTGKLYRLCKDLDPYRPAFCNQTGGSDPWKTGQTNLFMEPDLFTDILSWDVYPWGYPGGEDRMDALLEDSLNQVMVPLALRHRIPMMFWLQMINLYERLPTREEFLAEVFTLSMHGVRGFFTFFYKPDARELWDAAGELGSNWEDLSKVWLAAPPGETAVIRDRGLLSHRSTMPDGTRVFVFVNLGERPREVAVESKETEGAGCRVRELLSGKTVSIPADGALKDLLPGKGVRVFTIECPERASPAEPGNPFPAPDR
jgi:hypothetical protein